MVYEPEDDVQEVVEREAPEMHWRDHARKMAGEALAAKRDPQAEDSREQILARYVLRLL